MRARPTKASSEPDPPRDQSPELLALHEEHSASLLAFARFLSGSKERAEDALQEAYSRYLAARGDDAEINNARAWLLRVIHNLIVDWRKQESRQRELKPDHPAPDAPPDALPQDTHSTDALLAEAKGILSARELEVLTLRLQGLRYEDIAASLGIGIGSVSTYLTRSARKLRAARALSLR